MLDSDSMGRPKKYKLPDHMTFNRAKGRYVVRNPLSKREKSFAESEREQAERAALAVQRLIDVERQRAALSAGRPTIAGLVTKWLEDRLPFMPWSPRTRQNYVAKMNRIGRELGKRSIAHTDCMYLEDWISSFVRTADTFNDWRYVLVLLWSFAVSRKLAETNEAEKIEERSTSKKIEANRKQRQPLDVAGFKAIHEKADAWLQLAMELSLVTLQGRSEICNMQHAHFRDGRLYVIRDKVSGDSDMAFIKIAVTQQIEELRRRSLEDDGVTKMALAYPFLVHRQPDSMRREWIDPKPHWSYITPDYLSKAFAETRDKVQRFASMMPPRARPTFHEVRGLGARLYLEQGMAESDIQALMTHAHKRTTAIYLDRGAKALTDDDYQSVVAPMSLKDVL